MHARTLRIKNAMAEAKARDGHKCRVCGYEDTVCGSHLFPRNVQRPDLPELIVTLCPEHDREFDRIHHLPRRAQWLRDRRLNKWADEMARYDGRCAV